MGQDEISHDDGVGGVSVTLLRLSTSFLFLSASTSFLFLCFSFSLGFKLLNLTRHFPIGRLHFGTDGLPLGDPALDLVPKYLRVTLGVVKFGEAVFEGDSFNFYISNQVLGDSLGLGLLSFLGTKFVDKIIFVSDYLLA